jgi:transposase-like protein
MRWPNGVQCIACESQKISKITRTTEGKKNKRSVLYACLDCGKRFTPTVGTVFESSHLPLTKWFMAIAFVVDAKKGVSANQLKEHLGIGSYRTAWYMVHRIRKAMVELFPTKLSGIVEVDETYIGGKSKRRHRKASQIRGTKKDIVIGLRERGGRVRFFHVPNLKADNFKKLLDRHISTGVRRIMTDSASVYDFAMDRVSSASTGW